LSSPAWFYREAIEHQLERLGAQSWGFQDRSSEFRVTASAVDGDVELCSGVYGAVLRPGVEILRTLEQLNDNIGDARIAEALMGADGVGGR